MKLLVTGGAGFIGSNFIRYILANTSDEVINLDLLTYAGRRENLEDVEDNPRYTFVQGDIADNALVNSLVQEVDVIVNFAAESHVDRSIDQAVSFVRTNVLGTVVLLDAAYRNDKKRFHHISTDEVFGSLADGGKFTETTPYDPRSPYSASKAGADHLVRSYFHTHNLPVTISHCSNNYGPYQHPEKFIARSITNVLEGKKICVYGEGGNVRDWINVHDHVVGIKKVLDEDVIGESYAFGGNTERTNIQIAELIIEKMGADQSMIEFVEDRKGHDYRYAIDTHKVERELKWSPSIAFEHGLEETIQWYTEHESWWKPLKASQ